MKLLNYCDRDAILKAAREMGELTVANAAVAFYTDYSMEIQRQQSQFQSVEWAS